MKIGMVVNNLEVSGGYQKLVIRLSQQLVKKGHDVVIYTPLLNKKECYPADVKALTIVTIPRDIAVQTPATAYTELAKHIDHTLDAVIIHDELSLLALALLPYKPPATAWMLNNQLTETLGSFKTEMKSVYSQTVGPTKVKVRESKKAYDRVKLYRKGLSRVDHFATYDSFNQGLVERVLKRKAVVVSAGADLDSFSTYAKSRRYSSKKLYQVLSVGVVFPHRRYEDLIRALAIAHDTYKLPVCGVIVGRQDLSAEYFTGLTKLVKELGAQKYISFKHYVEDAEMVKLYKESDIFAFINDGFTWGISVFEAVAAGLPVIITNNIGAADSVHNNKTGWVVDPQSPDRVADAIREIVSDRKKAELIAQRAQKELSSFVSWSAYTDRMLALLQTNPSR